MRILAVLVVFGPLLAQNLWADPRSGLKLGLICYGNARIRATSPKGVVWGIDPVTKKEIVLSPKDEADQREHGGGAYSVDTNLSYGGGFSSVSFNRRKGQSITTTVFLEHEPVGITKFEILSDDPKAKYAECDLESTGTHPKGTYNDGTLKLEIHLIEGHGSVEVDFDPNKTEEEQIRSISGAKVHRYWPLQQIVIREADAECDRRFPNKKIPDYRKKRKDCYFSLFTAEAMKKKDVELREKFEIYKKLREKRRAAGEKDPILFDQPFYLMNLKE